MHKLVFALFDRLPLQFRVLYRQFLLRIVDLEALSIQPDIPGFVRQFAGVLILFSPIHTLIAWAYLGYEGDLVTFTLHMERYLIATSMLVAGLFSALTWDAEFPEKRATSWCWRRSRFSRAPFCWPSWPRRAPFLRSASRC